MVWLGGSSKMNRPRRSSKLQADQVHERPAARDEGLVGR